MCNLSRKTLHRIVTHCHCFKRMPLLTAHLIPNHLPLDLPTNLATESSIPAPTTNNNCRNDNCTRQPQRFIGLFGYNWFWWFIRSILIQTRRREPPHTDPSALYSTRSSYIIIILIPLQSKDRFTTERRYFTIQSQTDTANTIFTQFFDR